jgi:asparagine synthase (glutamine-hydrolysing)
MCGLVFLYQDDLPQPVFTERVAEALTKIAHRGPDDKGIQCEPPYAMGHRRLSIVDLSGSHQPFVSYDKRYVFAFNGEIYNYQELRSAFENRWAFRTNGDTEVLMAGLINHGPDFLKRAEGMWAFALWDKKEKTLMLGRDRMGKKPLYYYQTSEGIASASELNSLSILMGEDFQEDLDSTADYFRYGYYLPGFSAYKNVFEVLPGHVYTWSSDKSLNKYQYWEVPFSEYQGSKEDARQELRTQFVDAVKKRMVADVEVGAFLSGGIDSSLVVSVLSKLCDIHPKTFTIGFDDASYDERNFAKIIAKDCHTDHYEKCVNVDDAPALKNLLLNHIGQPFFDSSVLPTAFVSELASEHVKVVLSGDGGDELFSGYQRYTARNILRWYSRVPRSLRKGIKNIIRKLPEPMAHHSRSVLKKAHLFLDVVDRQTSETPYIAPVMYSDDNFRFFAPDLFGKGHQPPNLGKVENADDIYKLMYADSLIYLPQDILLKVDRASMASSIEARAPFLDSSVIELAYSLPLEWHRNFGVGKSFLKYTFKDLLPNDIWNRRKQGFAVPVHRWFRESMGAELLEMVEKSTICLNKAFIYDMLKQHKSSGRDNGYRLWAIYAYLLWKG